MAASVCRVCLAGNIRMLNIDNTHLQEIFEKLTNSKLSTETVNGMPTKLCYVCHQQLQRCHSFSHSAYKSEQIVQNLLKYDFEITHDTITMLSLKIKPSLTVSPIQYMVVNDYSSINSTPLAVKEEQVIVNQEEIEIQDIDIEEMKLAALDEDVQIGCDLVNAELPLVNDNILKNKQSCLYCDVCNKKVANKCSLVRHLKFHTGPYSCKRCDKTFTHSDVFRKHMMVHIGEKPYSCNSCNKTFNQKGHLKAHMRIHTGEKPYSCNICDRKFSEIGHIKKHKRIHTGEKRYSCSICDRRFTQMRNLKKDMQLCALCTLENSPR